MLELAVLHNGGSDLPTVTAPSGVQICGGSLAERFESYRRETINQIRQGILAEELGFHYWFLTEHHFQPEGAEYSPNPLMTEMAIAARTKRIRLGQLANILAWHHPVRLAEQAALLDVVSGGRLEFGIGRGYQSRETEVLGGPMGATVQDQERNRVYFEEAYAILLKAWTEPSFSYAGEFFTIPPTYTKWHHSQTMAYFEQPETGWELSRVLDVGEPDPVPNPMPVMGSTTTLREISVFPQPLQKPYPQIWQPVASERSIRWAARHGVNCHQQLEPTRRLKRKHRTVLRGGGEAGLAGPAGAGAVQVRLGRGEAARLQHLPLRPHLGAGEGEGGLGAVQGVAGDAHRLLLGVRLCPDLDGPGRGADPARHAGHGRDDPGKGDS